jgi:hypothetical protein
MSFTFRCYRNLKYNLGKLDAIVECNELAVREFVARARDFKDPSAYISDLSTQHEIRVNHVDFEHFRIRAAQLYILSVYQQAEDFLQGFRDEYPGSKDWTCDKDPLLECILKKVGGGFSINSASIGKFRLELFRYYRFIRNRFMHTKITDKRLDNQLSIVTAMSDEIQSNYKVWTAPNTFECLSFDDFLLFSRVAKDIGYRLCQLSRPTDEELAKMIEELSEKGEPNVDLKGMRKRLNSPTRLRNSLSGLVGSLYGLSPDESTGVVDILLRKIQEGSLA